MLTVLGSNPGQADLLMLCTQVPFVHTGSRRACRRVSPTPSDRHIRSVALQAPATLRASPQSLPATPLTTGVAQNVIGDTCDSHPGGAKVLTSYGAQSVARATRPNLSHAIVYHIFRRPTRPTKNSWPPRPPWPTWPPRKNQPFRVAAAQLHSLRPRTLNPEPCHLSLPPASTPTKNRNFSCIYL